MHSLSILSMEILIYLRATASEPDKNTKKKAKKPKTVYLYQSNFNQEKQQQNPVF